MEPAEVDSAVLLGLTTMTTRGIRIVVDDVASESMNPRTVAAISYLVVTPFAFGLIVVSDVSLVVTVRGRLLARVAGLCTDVGLISIYIGFAHGSTIVISTLEVMYFVVAAVISVVVLGENLTMTKLTGVAFAVLGTVLVTR